MNLGGTSSAGIATAVWANVARTLTQGGGLFYGFPTLALPVTSAISLTTVATTSCVTISAKQGIILAIGIRTNAATGTGSVTSFVDVITDGNTLSIPAYTGQTFDGTAKAVCNLISGTGGASNDTMNFFLGAGFLTSVTVQLRVTASTLTLGSTDIVVLWSHT